MIKYKNVQRVDENGVKSPLINKNVAHLVVNKEDELVGAKAVTVDVLDNLTVSYNGVEYDSDTTSITRMTAVAALASEGFNELLANGTDVAEAYDTVYKDTTIEWKGTDNKPHEVQIKSVIEALKLSMYSVASTVVK